MKITFIRKSKDNQLRISTKSFDKALERLAHDDAKKTVTRLRERICRRSTPFCEEPDQKTWHHIYPAAEFEKDCNNNLVIKQNNGVLLLTFKDIAKEVAIDEAKRNAAMLPSTLAAIEGTNQQTMHVLVRYTNTNGTLPTILDEANALYLAAYKQIMPIYRTLLNFQPDDAQPSIQSNFLITIDPTPYYNTKAAPIKVDADKSTILTTTHEDTDKNDTLFQDSENDSPKKNITEMMNFLKRKYNLRYNTVMKYTEFQQRQTTWDGFQAIEPRVAKRMALEVQLENIRATYKDVRNFLESDYIPSYDPIQEYLLSCRGQWDGKDHIRALARTVPTDNPMWEDWFYTWFLAMVEQWNIYHIHQYGNSLVPLLISRQGCNKSTFCRSLLPRELQWGYNDNLLISEKRQVLQSMSQFMLINLDEFNQISPTTQQGFLKNIIQLPTVKIKRPYGSHVEEFPRTASFIATSNVDDVLSDPSGSRRFIGVKLTGPIDVTVKPNHRQLYAQALTALDSGEKCYLNAHQTALLIESNKEFQVEMPVEQCFYGCFEPVSSEKEGEYMSVADIFKVMKERFGASLQVKSIITLGRKLRLLDNIKYKKSSRGAMYLVKLIN